MLPPLGDRVPPGWRDRWNPFKHRPLLPPDINPPGGNKGGSQPGGNQKGASPVTTKTTKAKQVKTPKRAKPIYTITTRQKLTWSEFTDLKSKGFIIDNAKTNSQKLTLINKLTNEIIEVNLNQGGPSWVKPTWSRTRLIKELQARGFKLHGSSKRGGGVIYRNSANEEFRIQPKPNTYNNGDPIEKHLNDYYFRYRPNLNQTEGLHTTIPD